MADASRTILFSTFEPSGDELAARTIAALRAREPGLTIYALGGSRMEAAGATLIEHTVRRGSMSAEDTLAQVYTHLRRLGRLREFLAGHRVDMLVPVDSPAGNWSICKAVRRAQPGARIVHLVAPQLWAWAPWRIGKMRRLSDHVLCILPFEPAWFEARGVGATFVGHPVYSPEGMEAVAAPPGCEELAGGHPRLVLLPGSRSGEIRRNWPTMLRTFVELGRTRAGLRGVVAALDASAAESIRRLARETLGEGGWPEGLEVVAGRTLEAIAWCDLALVASGTVTLQVARAGKPMVVMYNVSWLTLALLGWMVRTRTFTLPNLVSEWAGRGRVLTELIPHRGGVPPVAGAVSALMDDAGALERAREGLAAVAGHFGAKRFGEESAARLLEHLERGPRV